VSGQGLFYFLDPFENPRWDEMVATHPGCTFFHSSAWARVLKSAYDYKPCYFLKQEAKQPIILLPIMEVDSPLTGRRGIALPFTDECAPLFFDGTNSDAVLGEVLDHGRSCRWKYFECRGGRNHFKAATPSISFYLHTVDLTKTRDELFGRLESSVRRAIRKAESSGIRVERLQTLEAMRVFYSLHETTRRKHGLPPQPFAFFRQIHEHVVARNLGFVLIAYSGKIPVAGAVFFHFGRKAIYKFGASDTQFVHLRGNNLVMWEAIRWFAHNGFSELSMGRTEMANDGLRRFKQGWGTSEEILEYWRFDFDAGKFVTTPDKVQGWHNRIFRLLPRAASRWAGALIYRHIA
jgi:hypothetical protein